MPLSIYKMNDTLKVGDRAVGETRRSHAEGKGVKLVHGTVTRIIDCGSPSTGRSIYIQPDGRKRSYDCWECNVAKTALVKVTSEKAILHMGAHAEVQDAGKGFWRVLRAGVVSDLTKLEPTTPATLWLLDGQFQTL